MKHKVIPSMHSMIIILACFLLAGSFIFLSMQKLNEDVEMITEAADFESMYMVKSIFKEPELITKRIDILFEYDTRQIDEMYVVHYKITNDVGLENITQGELDVLLNCYKNNICDEIDISEKTEHIIKNYKNFIIKEDVVVVYGLYPKNSPESFSEVENNVFVISDDLFAQIVNPIYSKTAEKYNKIRRSFLRNNVGIDYSQYNNEAWIAQKDVMIQDAISEITQEESVYIKDDIELLSTIAKSVEIVEKDVN